MVAWLIVAVLLQATPASCASTQSSRLSRFKGGHAEGATSAVLSATGEGYLSNHSSVPTACICDQYKDRVDKDTERVCIDGMRTCGLTGCGSNLCEQMFHPECTDHCSEWADAQPSSINVCQDKKDGYKCSGQPLCDVKTSYKCRQKPVEHCPLFCEGYESAGGTKTVSLESDLVCQNVDPHATNLGICLPLPCSITHHNSNDYNMSKVCKQTVPNCKNTCAEHSEVPNSTTTCMDEYSEVCENHLICPKGTHVRCTPIHHHMNEKNIAKEAPFLLETSKKAVADLAKGPGRAMTQAEWRNEQQRVRIQALREELQHNVQQQQRRKIMRKDAS